MAQPYLPDDPEMDILSIAGLETPEEHEIVCLHNGAELHPPLTWEQMGFIIPKTAESPEG